MGYQKTPTLSSNNYKKMQVLEVLGVLAFPQDATVGSFRRSNGYGGSKIVGSVGASG
nr:hypothetical protein [Tanacetum cinerariifolium]